MDANPRVRTNLPEPQSPPRDMLEQAGPEGNIAVIKADQVWSTYGITGDGVVVAVNDTGVQWTHEALLNTYRGWNGVGSDHTYSWHDAVHSNNHGANSCGTDATAPCDDFGHGTNVAGIIGGRTASNQIGVAPGTEWIACRCMDNGYGTPASYLECLQWFLAPGGDVAKAPDIINNSWSCPPSEGCSQATLESAFLTVRAAGIMVVARNENTGPSCASATDPPGMYEASFSVGATDNSDNLAGFSSRGPVTYNGKTYTKPDISAPRSQHPVFRLRRRIHPYDRYIHGRAARGGSRRLALVRESDIEGSHRSHGGYPQNNCSAQGLHELRRSRGGSQQRLWLGHCGRAGRFSKSQDLSLSHTAVAPAAGLRLRSVCHEQGGQKES